MGLGCLRPRPETSLIGRDCPPAALVELHAGNVHLVAVRATSTVLARRVHLDSLGVAVGVFADAVLVESRDRREVGLAGRAEVEVRQVDPFGQVASSAAGGSLAEQDA
jgi:hypothetical protein